MIAFTWREYWGVAELDLCETCSFLLSRKGQWCDPDKFRKGTSPSTVPAFGRRSVSNLFSRIVHYHRWSPDPEDDRSRAHERIPVPVGRPSHVFAHSARGVQFLVLFSSCSGCYDSQMDCKHGYLHFRRIENGQEGSFARQTKKIFFRSSWYL